MPVGRLQFREITPCPVRRFADNVTCERELGHEPPHWVTIWMQERGEEGELEWWPSYPETW